MGDRYEGASLGEYEMHRIRANRAVLNQVVGDRDVVKGLFVGAARDNIDERFGNILLGCRFRGRSVGRQRISDADKCETCESDQNREDTHEGHDRTSYQSRAFFARMTYDRK